jgi:L-rhamnonate dehydratase
MRKIVDIETMVFESPKLERRWNEAPVQHSYSKYPESGQIDTLSRTWGHFAVKTTCDDGTYGYGSTGTYNVCRELINTFFKPLLMGKNPFEIERIWDLMFSGSVGFGRRGAALMAISAIDIALWEILDLFKNPKDAMLTIWEGEKRQRMPKRFFLNGCTG